MATKGTTKASSGAASKDAVCPIIVNQTNYSVVVFLERGILYNKQVLRPNEAVGMKRGQTSYLLPYWVHALVGNEESLPTRAQSVKNLVSVVVIPTAFVVGVLATAGALTGPSAALAPLVSGLTVPATAGGGVVVIDAAAIAAGTVLATRAAMIADALVQKHPEKFMTRSKRLMPGKRFVVVRGGVNAALTVSTISEREFRRCSLNGNVKEPMDTIRDKIQYYLPTRKQEDSTHDNNAKS